jgi:hypothetical protein
MKFYSQKNKKFNLQAWHCVWEMEKDFFIVLNTHISKSVWVCVLHLKLCRMRKNVSRLLNVVYRMNFILVILGAHTCAVRKYCGISLLLLMSLSFHCNGNVIKGTFTTRVFHLCLGFKLSFNVWLMDDRTQCEHNTHTRMSCFWSSHLQSDVLM